METTPDFRDVQRVAEVFHQLGHAASPDALSEEAKRILGAAEPEYEFMAIAIWSGRCSLIHKLPPDKYPHGADKQYKIPDLFVVFEYEGRSVSALVEVKSTYTAVRPGPLKLAKLSPSYRHKLQNYGKLLGFPVLVAQQVRPSGIWFLVDLDTIGVGGQPTVDPGYDLMGLLLGTFHLVFKAGTKFVFRIEKNRVISDKEFEGTVKAAHWQTADGATVRSTKSPMLVLFDLGDPVETEEDGGDSLTLTYEIPSRMAFADYQALRAAILYDRQLKLAQLPWAEMLKSGRFPVSRESIESAHQDRDFFEYSMTTKPKHVPSFLLSAPGTRPPATHADRRTLSSTDQAALTLGDATKKMGGN